MAPRVRTPRGVREPKETVGRSVDRSGTFALGLLQTLSLTTAPCGVAPDILPPKHFFSVAHRLGAGAEICARQSE